MAKIENKVEIFITGEMLLSSAMQLIKDIEKISFCGKEKDCQIINHMTKDWLKLLDTKKDGAEHGEWVFKRRYYDADECNCSECGQLMTTHAGKRMNYCPRCGCKMDLGGADNGE